MGMGNSVEYTYYSHVGITLDLGQREREGEMER